MTHLTNSSLSREMVFIASKFSSNKAETPTITSDMMFKLENSKLVVDLDGMEQKKIAKIVSIQTIRVQFQQVLV